MFPEKYLGAATVVRLEQARDEGSDRVDAHARENNYREFSPSISHDDRKRTSEVPFLELWFASFQIF